MNVVFLIFWIPTCSCCKFLYLAVVIASSVVLSDNPLLTSSSSISTFPFAFWVNSIIVYYDVDPCQGELIEVEDNNITAKTKL